MAARRVIQVRRFRTPQRFLVLLAVALTTTGCVNGELDAAMWSWRLM